MSHRKLLQALIAGLLSRLIPRSDNIWVCGGNKGLRFADNSMFFFKYCNQETKNEAIWLTKSDDVLKQVRSEGYRAYKSNSILGIYYGFRAKWHIFDVGIRDTSSFSSVGAKQLNLWHGYPLKDIRCLKPTARKPAGNFLSSAWRWLCNYPQDNSHYFVIHLNKKHIWQMTESFDVREEHVIIANFPRNEVFVNESFGKKNSASNAQPWTEKFANLRESGKSVIGYFPTWRTGDTDQFLGTRSVKEIVSFNDFLNKHELYFATKWHTCVFKEYQHEGGSDSAESLNSAMHSLSNIIVLDFTQDLNSLLNSFDVLVSDYSSVIIDYLLTDRPQIFMAYDLEAYRKEWGFMFDYEEFVPGPITKTIPELEAVLSQYSNSKQDFCSRFQEQRADRRDEIFDTLSSSNEIIKSMELVS